MTLSLEICTLHLIFLRVKLIIGYTDNMLKITKFECQVGKHQMLLETLTNQHKRGEETKACLLL